MIVLKEADYTIPPDIHTTVHWAELLDIIDRKALNSGSTLFTYGKTKPGLRIVSSGMKEGSIKISNQGIEIDYRSLFIFIYAANIDKITYSEKHFINGGRPLSTITVFFTLKDGNTLDFVYQIVDHWRV